MSEYLDHLTTSSRDSRKGTTDKLHLRERKPERVHSHVGTGKTESGQTKYEDRISTSKQGHHPSNRASESAPFHLIQQEKIKINTQMLKWVALPP